MAGVVSVVISAGFSESGVPPELASLAQDIAADVKTLVGPAKFGEAYSAVRTRVMSVRQERKRKRVTEKILDPQVRYTCRSAVELRAKQVCTVEQPGNNKDHAGAVCGVPLVGCGKTEG